MKKIGLVQINVDFGTEYLPLSVGCLQAYAETDPFIRSNYSFLPPVYKRLANIEENLALLQNADIVCFSVYVWSTRYSLEMARRLKEFDPKKIIIFGGPNMPERAEHFLRSNSFIDYAIHGEGEQAFHQFLAGLMEGDLSKVGGLRYINNKTGSYHAQLKSLRIPKLDEIPSPYLAGIFKPLIEMDRRPVKTWNALWETNRGCPFSCTYCDWGSATQAKVNRFEMDRLFSEIEWFHQNRVEYLMICDANFGILERDIEIAQRLADAKINHGYPKIVAATFTKNATERSYEIAKILMGAELLRGYTVSTQSVDMTTLKNIRRDNISQKSFTDLQARFNRNNLPTYTDLIIGLPGETYESFRLGINRVIETKQYNKIYFILLQILPNSQMGDPVYREKHGFITELVPQKNLHESVKSADSEITELQEMVVGTSTLNLKDWVKTVCLAWMTSLIYFNKLLHLPVTVLLNLKALDLASIAEVFMECAQDEEAYPLLAKIQKVFEEKARSIQLGQPEYCAGAEFGWMDIWWQPDKIAFMEVCKNLDQFYIESCGILEKHLLSTGKNDLIPTLIDALILNKALVRQGFQVRPAVVQLKSNLYEYYLSLLEQTDVALVKGEFQYNIVDHNEQWDSIDTWCREVVWFCNKTSAYLSLSIPAEAASLASKGGQKFDPVALKPYFYA